MKLGVVVLILAIVGVGSWYISQAENPPAQARKSAAVRRADLEGKIGEIFLYQPRIDDGEVYDRAAEIEKLGHRQDVQEILIEMLKKYHPSEAEGNLKELLILEGATQASGNLGIREAVEPLTKLLLDTSKPTTVRALAATSLGQIDLETNKEVLLNALHFSAAEDDPIRISAAEALARTKDPRVLQELEKRAAEEPDSVIKGRIETAAREVRARISRQKN